MPSRLSMDHIKGEMTALRIYHAFTLVWSNHSGVGAEGVWGIDIPRILTSTRTCDGPPDGPLDGLSSETDHWATARPGELDPRRRRPYVRVMCRLKH
jgi:hypothetical protein